MNEKQYARLLSHLVEQDGCLVWTGFIDTRGYGRYLHKRVHRLYWEYHNGPIPEGTELAHEPPCTNKLCVRHVCPKTHVENMQEYSGKTLQQFCKRGHELTEDNIYVRPGTTFRRCRKCNRYEQTDAYRLSKKTQDSLGGQ